MAQGYYWQRTYWSAEQWYYWPEWYWAIQTIIYWFDKALFTLRVTLYRRTTLGR